MGNSFSKHHLTESQYQPSNLHRILTFTRGKGTLRDWQGYMPPILPEDLYRELEVSRVSGRVSMGEFWKVFFFGRFFFSTVNVCLFCFLLRNYEKTRSSVEELEKPWMFFVPTQIVPIKVLNGLDETKLFISVHHLFNVFLEGISGENTYEPRYIGMIYL